MCTLFEVDKFILGTALHCYFCLAAVLNQVTWKFEFNSRLLCQCFSYVSYVTVCVICGCSTGDDESQVEEEAHAEVEAEAKEDACQVQVEKSLYRPHWAGNENENSVNTLHDSSSRTTQVQVDVLPRTFKKFSHSSRSPRARWINDWLNCLFLCKPWSVVWTWSARWQL